jgi:hypothetical protein
LFGLLGTLEAGGSSATEPYIEESYNSSQQLTAAVLHGHSNIRNYAFEYCSSLTSMTIPDSVTSIGHYAFQICRNLTSVTFKGTPSSISSNTFSDCSVLNTINVPWAEGSVSDAPWGATNATINYNYTGE